MSHNIEIVKERMHQACKEAGRSMDDVELIAVSKMFTADKIIPALEQGQRVFGENRVQEAQGKWPDLREKICGC